MQSRRFTNRRRSERASVLLPASVVTMSAYQYFDLVTLSAGGAKLRGSSLPAVGRPGLFRLDGYKVMCRVVWAHDELCGVQFDELIPPKILERFREAGNTAQLGMLTPDEKQAEEEWANGAGS